jgi:SAM-dependent methyltransferase
MFPAEEMPFADGAFDLATARVAPHYFSSPPGFVHETVRVLTPGGHFLLIDGTVPDDDPETEEWLHCVEKWRAPSHGRFLSRSAWQALAAGAGLKIMRPGCTRASNLTWSGISKRQQHPKKTANRCSKR